MITKIAGTVGKAGLLFFLLLGACDGEDKPVSEAGVVGAGVVDGGVIDGGAGSDAPLDRGPIDTADAQPNDRPPAAPDGLADVRLAVDLQDVNAGDESFAAAAGLWTGLTSQKLPVSFVLSEDGTITDVSVRLRLTYEDGGTCAATFVADTVNRIVNGRVRLNVVQTQIGFFSVPIEIGFTSGTVAVGALAGWAGAYKVRCGDETGEGRGELIPPSTFELKRLQGVTAPLPTDQMIATGYGGPVLAGAITSGCSQSGSGNVYCAFTRTSALGELQLWVMQMPGLAGSPSVPCGSGAGTASPGCRLLTSGLYLDAAPRDPITSYPRFVGDTLIFFADAIRADGIMHTEFHAWRPGWSNARVLMEGASTCTANASSDAVVCTAGFQPAATGPLYMDLWAGHLGDGTQPLIKIARPMILRSTDQAKSPKPYLYDYELSPDGNYLLWSARAEDTATAKETLWFHKLGEPLTNIRTYGTDIGRWQLSRDGSRLFWLANIDHDVSGVLPGTLTVGSFPNPTTLPARVVRNDVANYFEGPSSGPSSSPPSNPSTNAVTHVVTTLELSGRLSFQSAVESPGPGVEVAQGVSQVRNWSPDGGALAFAKEVDATTWSDLLVARVGPVFSVCSVEPRRDWGSPVFSASGSKLLAIRYVGSPNVNNELVAIDPTNCRQQVVAGNPGYFGRVGADRFVVSFDYQQLRKNGMASLGILDVGASSPIVARIDGVANAFSVARTSDALNETFHMVYSVNAGWRSDGLYRRTVILPAR